jgi:apolipoprotein N-acyltransferase
MKKDIFLSLLSSLLLTLSFPNYNLWILAWFGFVPLFFILENKSKAKAFLFFYFTGVIFWSGIIYWLIHVTLPGTIVLILYLAIYFGIFGLIVSSIIHRPSSIVPSLFVPSVWVLLEYLRGHLMTGFPWALLGHSQYLNLPVIQIADITGAWGVSFLVMLVNTTIYAWVTKSPSHQVTRIKKTVLTLLCIVITLGYGYYKLYPSPRHPAPPAGRHVTTSPVKVSVIQGNILQELKWNPGAKDYIINKYLGFSAQAVKDKPDLVIWPEAALPVILEEEPIFFERVKDFARGNKTSLLLGAVTKRDNLYYNSALLVSGRGEPAGRYDKLHLVPFGEYIPLKRILPFLETIVPIGDISAGREYTVFSQGTRYFSVLICFEDLFPELASGFVKSGAQFLVNITNDAWYKKTSAAHQHLQASVFRAVENRVPLVRAANTGVSGFILPSGKIISLVQDKNGREIFIDGYKAEKIALQKRPLSFYARYGDIFVALCFLFVLYGIISPFKKKQ